MNATKPPAAALVFFGAALSGLLLGLVAALILGALDDSIRKPSELARALGVPCVGELGHVSE